MISCSIPGLPTCFAGRIMHDFRSNTRKALNMSACFPEPWCMVCLSGQLLHRENWTWHTHPSCTRSHIHHSSNLPQPLISVRPGKIIILRIQVCYHYTSKKIRHGPCRCGYARYFTLLMIMASGVEADVCGGGDAEMQSSVIHPLSHGCPCTGAANITHTPFSHGAL